MARAQGGAHIRVYIENHCLDCHEGKKANGGLDLSTLGFSLGDRRNFDTWVRLYDRVSSGEMPPATASQPPRHQTTAFLLAVADPLVATDLAQSALQGRATRRRLNRHEYEQSLRALLATPWLPIKDLLPEDGEAFRFNKVGDALDVSHVQMAQYLAAAEQAMRDVLENQPLGLGAPPVTRYYARQMRAMVQHISKSAPHTGHVRAAFPVLGSVGQPDVRAKTAPMTAGSDDPARRDLEGVGFVHGAYEPIEPKFDGFQAPVSGRYRLRINAHSVWVGSQGGDLWWNPDMDAVSRGRRPEPITLYGERPPTLLRRLDVFDAGPDPTTATFDVDLLAGETVRVDASRFFRSRPARTPNRPLGSAFHNPLATRDGQPGISYRWLDVQGPLVDATKPSGVAVMFGDLAVKVGGKGQITVMSDAPDLDARRLMQSFVARAYRYPVTPGDAEPYLSVVSKALAAGDSFADAMLSGYAAVLCSPAFLYLNEKPGFLDDWAMASRLSYFLWNSPPDDVLRADAQKGDVAPPRSLRFQALRLLNDQRSRRFVDGFLDYWLDLRRIGSSTPDAVLYPDYNLDDHLVESATEEPRRFFADLLHADRPARNIIDSDFLIVNERLAFHYGLPRKSGQILGANFVRVNLVRPGLRGGLLTQASVLKVTSNGTTTSPVVRGAWIGERLLGVVVPPPPAGVPAVEPDIRGAQTIRDQLAKHRADKLCASCHNKIDPAGFALESFDVFGGYRTQYRAMGEGDVASTGIGKDGIRFEFRQALPVDPTGVLPGGARFRDVRDLKRALLRDERQIARNLTNQLIVYATGSPVRFGDRPQVERILDRAAASGYGVRTLVLQIIDSVLFRQK